MLTWIRQNVIFIAYANQKLFRENLWGVVSTPFGIQRVNDKVIQNAGKNQETKG